MTNRRRATPAEVLERELLKMKAMGVTISYKPSPIQSDHPGRRMMETVHAKAQELGMTYGDEPTEAKEQGE